MITIYITYDLGHDGDKERTRPRCRLHLHSIRGPTLRLVCADGAQLAFWWLGVFDLTSAPAAERASHGLLLWRLAAALYAEEAARRRHHAARG